MGMAGKPQKVPGGKPGKIPAEKHLGLSVGTAAILDMGGEKTSPGAVCV